MYYKERNTITIPVSGMVDVEEFLPLIDSEAYQKLRNIKQLGYAYKKFPGATHSRFEHGIGTLHMYRMLLNNGHINVNDYEKKLGEAQALLHDIGHGPFSHQIDGLIGENHNERGLEIISTKLKDQLKKCMIDPDDLIEGFKNPLYQLVSSIHGADKIDYVIRDSHHVYDSKINTEPLLKHSVYDSKIGFCVAEQGINDLLSYIDQWYLMHFKVYWDKTVMTAESMLGRALKRSLDSGILDPNKLSNISENEVESILKSSDSSYLMKRLDAGPTNFYKAAISFKIKGYENKEITDGKSLIMSIEQKDAEGFPVERDGIDYLIELEKELSSMLNTDVIVSTTPMPKRIRRRNINIYSNEKGVMPLSEIEPKYTEFLDSRVGNTWVARIIVPQEYREYVGRKADAIVSKLMEYANTVKI